MNFTLVTIVVIVGVIVGTLWLVSNTVSLPQNTITTFEECTAAGNPIMESFPRQCRTENGELFVEDIGNALEKQNLIRLKTPRPNTVITSPLLVQGEARGFWFFEADFPVRLFDADGNELTVAVAQSEGEWMTEEFVPFRTTLTFDAPQTTGGVLVLERDNPSGLPQNADELRVPIQFE